MILVICVLAILGLAVRAETAPIDVRLTVEETAGVDRLQWPVTAGIPLPKGVLKSTERLQILDAQGRFVPARFAVASRWWEDGSIQWVHCDFAATVKANNQAILFLRDVVPLPEFPSPIGFIPRGKEFEVITGPLRLVLGGNSNQLLDQVWVDEGWGYNFDERTKILDSGNFDLVLTSAGRNYRTSHWTQNLVEVEEYNALRAVVKISGSFALADSKDKRLDYLARLTVYGGKTYFKLDFTLLNRAPGTALAEVPVDDLAFSFKMNLDLTQQRFVFGGKEVDHVANFEAAPEASLFQESADHYILTGALQGSGAGKNTNSGWADLSDAEHGLAVAVRWFWQLYPKAFEVRSDGTLTLKLFPSQARGHALLPGTARTHEMLFHFHGRRHFASGQVKRVLLGFQKPLYAVAPGRWYCQDTNVFGPLAEGASDALKPELVSLFSEFDAWVLKRRNALLAARDTSQRVGDRLLDGYGVFRFSNWLGDFDTEAAASPVRGDLPHALYLHFFRTGDLRSLEFAEESLAHAADVGLVGDVSSVGQPAGTAIEGLFDSFLLTGNRRHLDAARLLAGRLSRDVTLRFAETTADVGSALLGVLRSYEVTGDRRWLNNSLPLLQALHAWQDGDSAKLASTAPVLAKRWKEDFRDSLGESAWHCGPVWEALRRYHELVNDKTVFSRIERSADWILRSRSEWDVEQKRLARSPQLGMVLAPGLMALSEATGNIKYRDLAKDLFRTSIQAVPVVNDPGLFALCLTTGQQFLGYLSKEFQTSPKRDVSLAGRSGQSLQERLSAVWFGAFNQERGSVDTPKKSVLQSLR
jgi:Beta-L-arabinofuranosidase, GH127 catalytic domain